MSPPDVETDGGRGPSQATRLVEIADSLHLWHTPDQEPYATHCVAKHLENWSTRSTAFKRFLAAEFYRCEGTAPNPQAIQSALSVLEGRAIHEGERHDIYVRVAGVANDPLFYIDLCNENWEAVEVNAAGWSVITSHKLPKKFRRASGMQALPVPEHGGSLDELRPFINVASESDFILFVSWLVGALRPFGPYPVLGLHGEQGSAKTTAARIARALTDPNTAPVRAEPRQGRDLMISARNGWVIALDNLSRLPPWFSDALCRLSTGGGFATRALFSDDEEAIFDAQRPIILTGINEVATRGDLLDRAILLTLPSIRPEARRTETEYWAAFEEARPRLFGALLDAAVTAMRDSGRVELVSHPRMADFAAWVVAAEPSLPWKQGEFLKAYEGNRKAADTLALDANLLSQPLRELIEGGNRSGTAKELLDALDLTVSEKTRDGKEWPKSPRSLSSVLRRLAPNFRSIGIEIEFDQTSGMGSRKLIHIRREKPCDASDASNLKLERAVASSGRRDEQDTLDGALS